ncbi:MULTISPECIES: biotin-dependent carboxyltransferase family protein [unclassified Methylophaga]|uniref:5-oxoprolinase subunit C family protein n=1 Tax=unclassified Methylophaga TaxID=2629249 RepID=UPI000C97B538|nr:MULTISPECIES: biotin-dependent carboxyltransferase family protein [unclassified Methylophaga]MBN46471.1 allophanate hydrolase [Methylophaga sp.]|tara:strand:+ start:223575 stop:224504 length:930 start_codon:yes stop_codon:yes gene_type:complete
MKQPGLKVLKPGILTLVQDLGRFAYQHIGLSPGGAADEHAFLWANRLLDNRPNHPALEICFGGLQLEALTNTNIAITGADMQASINGEPLENWQTHPISTGDILSFAHAKSGIRSYLAIQDGFQFEPCFGSVATVMREKMGGIDGDGNPLKADDFLPCSQNRPRLKTHVPPLFIPDYQQPLILSVIPTDQTDHFDIAEQEKLYHWTYRISMHSNNMGIRLEGEPIIPNVQGIISEGIAYGTIQLPPDGQPIILLKDRQTMGGYPKLGTLFVLDAFLLAQQQANTEVRFTQISLEEAQEKLRYFYRFFGV